MRESMARVVLKGFILVPSSDLPAVIVELENHKALSLNETGCLIFSVSQSEENPNRFDVHEEFIDKSAFLAHQERVKNSFWGKVSVNVERHYEIFE